MERVVVALGGNALLQRGEEDTAVSMRRSARFAAEVVADIAEQGWEVVVTHGNGPQVGRILIQNEEAARLVSPMPLDVCGAQSQGQIGYLLQVAVGDVFFERGMDRPVATVLTLTRVPGDDPAFGDPTKPIGPYYGKEKGKRLARERGYRLAPAPGGGGWRRVVPSPRPYSIVEAPVIRQLVASGVIVIAGGGGGVPVVEEGPRLVGVEGVVDKDLAACILAKDVEADALLILTDVDGVYEEFGTAEQRLLPRLTPEEARRRLEAGEFGTGSMKPKVEAAVQFVQGGGKQAVIAALEAGARALAGKAGTVVEY